MTNEGNVTLGDLVRLRFWFFFFLIMTVRHLAGGMFGAVGMSSIRCFCRCGRVVTLLERRERDRQLLLSIDVGTARWPSNRWNTLKSLNVMSGFEQPVALSTVRYIRYTDRPKIVCKQPFEMGGGSLGHLW